MRRTIDRVETAPARPRTPYCAPCGRPFQTLDGSSCRFCGAPGPRAKAPAPSPAPAPAPPASAGAPRPLADRKLEDRAFGVDRAAERVVAADRFRRGLLLIGLGVAALLIALAASSLVTAGAGRVLGYWIAGAIACMGRGVWLATSKGDGLPEDD
jgi:hypothetical protein